MKLRNKKTGEIKEFDSVKVLKNSDCTIAQFSYDTLAELNEEWEDYEPDEPHIKDEKVRKAVRAWAEAANIDEVMFEYINNYGSVLSDGSTGIKICFYSDLHLVSRSDYTIAELCGEEEV